MFWMDDGTFALDDSVKGKTWTCCYKRLLNVGNSWEENLLTGPNRGTSRFKMTAT